MCCAVCLRSAGRRCLCDEGFGGDACAERTCAAPGCGQHGLCVDGTCYCTDGHDGRHCEVSHCPSDCSGHGVRARSPVPSRGSSLHRSRPRAPSDGRALSMAACRQTAERIASHRFPSPPIASHRCATATRACAMPAGAVTIALSAIAPVVAALTNTAMTGARRGCEEGATG